MYQIFARKKSKGETIRCYEERAVEETQQEESEPRSGDQMMDGEAEERRLEKAPQSWVNRWGLHVEGAP